MKWKSKDGKEGLDLDKIGYWKYTSLEDAQAFNAGVKEMQLREPESCFTLLKNERNELEIYMGGDGPLIFTGDEAEEVYKMLISRKEVI